MYPLTIDDAKEWFVRYDGGLFSMHRDDPKAYARFCELVTEDVHQKWLKELVELHFAKWHESPDAVWTHHRRLIGLISQLHGDIRAYIDRLLDAMAGMPTDPLQVTLMIENMAGRTDPQRDGGCYLIVSRTHAAGEMQRVMLPYLRYTCEGEQAARLAEAKRAYVRAEYRFCDDAH